MPRHTSKTEVPAIAQLVEDQMSSALLLDCASMTMANQRSGSTRWLHKSGVPLGDRELTLSAHRTYSPFQQAAFTASPKQQFTQRDSHRKYE
jgi:hypothetical protein